MASIGPYSKSEDYTHMYDFTDLRSCVAPKVVYCPKSLMGIIDNTPKLSKISYIIKLAGIDGILNDELANFTLFLPSDDFLTKYPESLFVNFDKGTARNIMNNSMMNRRITSDLLKDSPASFFTTLNNYNKMFVTNINDITCINHRINIVQFDISCSNGLIHITDDIIR